MAKMKEGEVRVLKGGRIYGPMMDAELERLLVSGRITSADQISVSEGPWRPIADYLAQRAAAPVPRPAPAARPAAAPKPPAAPARAPVGELCVLKGQRTFNDLTRSQVTAMFAQGQIGGDDLVCARGGPWMRVGDFCAVAPPRGPARARPKVEAVEVEAVEIEAVEIEAVEAVEVEAEVVEVVPARTVPTEVVVEVVEVEEVVAGEEDLEVVSAGPTGLRLDDLLDDLKPLSDEWYVRAHGIHSAPLKNQHVKMLFLSWQITLDCPARHASWRAERWLPIHDIPELADFVRSP